MLPIAVRGFLDLGAGDHDGLGPVNTDARAIPRRKSGAKALDKADGLALRPRRQSQPGLGKLDDHTVRIVEGENVVLSTLWQPNDKTRAQLVALQRAAGPLL